MLKSVEAEIGDATLSYGVTDGDKVLSTIDIEFKLQTGQVFESESYNDDEVLKLYDFIGEYLEGVGKICHKNKYKCVTK